MFLLFMFDNIVPNSHTTVYTDTFVVDLSYMQSIKQLTDELCVCGLYELSVHLFV
jgi:hypothetical protein